MMDTIALVLLLFLFLLLLLAVVVEAAITAVFLIWKELKTFALLGCYMVYVGN
jgi:hypothetical protein